LTVEHCEPYGDYGGVGIHGDAYTDDPAGSGFWSIITDGTVYILNVLNTDDAGYNFQTVDAGSISGQVRVIFP